MKLTALAGLIALSISAVACVDSTDADDADDDSSDATVSDLSVSAINKGIVVNESILGVAFDATREKVRADLGKPTTAKNAKHAVVGIPIKTYTYGATTIDFYETKPGSWQVYDIMTRSPKLRTEKGSIGVGSTEKDLEASFPGANCETIQGYRSCTYGGDFFEKHMTFGIDKTGRVSDVFFGVVLD